MPQGKPQRIPDDGLTTRARRRTPVLAVHTGDGKGKSTAAFGMALRAWNAGLDVGVFQFVKSAKWKVGEEAAFGHLGRLHEHGVGGAVEWHKMGSGWSWTRKPRNAGGDVDHAAAAADGWAEIARRLAAQRHDFYVLDEFTYPLNWGWVDVDEVVAGPGGAARPPARRHHRARRPAAIGRRRRPGDRDGQGQAPDGRGPQGPEGHRMVSAPIRPRERARHAHANRACRCHLDTLAREVGEAVTSAPAVIVAAPASGSGKTTVATGLIGALRRAGHTVAPFKVGPDFIDPGYHGLAAGRPGRNLDPVLVGERLIGPLYAHGAAGADIAVVEGVMGLFDGRIGAGAATPAPGSTAHVAGLLGAPVLLVVDARGQSHSIAALLHGFSTFDTATRIAGVILNRVGSSRHEQVLRQACRQVGVPVLGAIPRTAELELPTRYLGLVTAVEYGRRARAAVEAMTALVARHVDLAALFAIAASRPAGPSWEPAAATGETGEVRGRRPTVAMAAGKAFSFGYAEHTELLRAAGADVAEFDPLVDALPGGADAVVLPGGFPEQFTAELSANDVVRRQIRELAARGAPVHAECAGLVYLVSELDGHPMCGVLAGSARFTPRLTLAYRDAVAAAESPLYAVGQPVVGHEFHRTAVTFDDSYPPAWVYRGSHSNPDSNRGEPAVRDGAVRGGVHASYLHTHPAAAPEAVVRFVAHASGAPTPPV